MDDIRDLNDSAEDDSFGTSGIIKNQHRVWFKIYWNIENEHSAERKDIRMMRKCFFAAVIMAAILLCAAASADVEICDENFPDPFFFNIAVGYDTNFDSYLQDSEIAIVDALNCEGSGITDLKGIEYFTEMKFLTVSNNQLTKLDLSGNQKLRVVYCDHNRLTSLKVSDNVGMEFLDCQYNQLKQLEVPRNPKLEGLICHHNQIKQLDISYCGILVDLTKYGGYENFGTYSEWYGDDFILSVDNSVKLITKPSDSSADHCTIGGLKYKLSGSKATVTGPESKTAVKLTIPSAIKVNGRKYQVTGIKSGAFRSMKKLTAVTIGANVKTIGKNAFRSCPKLKTLTIKTKNLTSSSVGSDAFRGIYKKATFHCPQGKVKAYKKMLLKKGAPKTAKFK